MIPAHRGRGPPRRAVVGHRLRGLLRHRRSQAVDLGRRKHAADVQEAAKTWLDKRRSVTGYLVKGPAKPEERRS